MPHNVLRELVKASNPVPNPAVLLDQESVRILFEDVMHRADDPHASTYQLGEDVNWRRDMQTKHKAIDLEPSLIEPEKRWWPSAAVAAIAAVIAIVVLAVILRDGDDNTNFITENTTSTTEVSASTEVSTTAEAATTTEVSTTMAVDPGPPRQQSAPLQAPDPSNFGQLGDVPDSLVTLQATEDEAAFTIVTAGLLPGHPVTAWLVAADVEACLLAFPQREECQKSLVMQQPEVGNIGYLGGGIVAEDGSLTIEGTITSDGIPRQWYETPLASFLDTQFAVLLNDHGEPIEELLDEMTASYRAGCNDGSVLGAPDIALADGTPGPNSCAERQTVTFDPVPG